MPETSYYRRDSWVCLGDNGIDTCQFISLDEICTNCSTCLPACMIFLNSLFHFKM